MRYLHQCPLCHSDKGISVSAQDHYYFFSFTGDPLGRVKKLPHETREAAVQCSKCYESIKVEYLVRELQGLISDILEPKKKESQ